MIEDTIKIAKSMKRPIVYITDSYMLGSDEEFYTLSRINIHSDISRPMCFRISECLAGSAKDKFAQTNPERFFSEYTEVQEGLYINAWAEPNLMQNIMNVFGKLMSYLDTYNIIYSSSGFESDENFKTQVSKLKVSDGLKYFTIDNKYLLSSFNKVHSINASDKVSINIYDIDIESYLCEFVINKKKYTLQEYIRYRKMFS